MFCLEILPDSFSLFSKLFHKSLFQVLSGPFVPKFCLFVSFCGFLFRNNVLFPLQWQIKTKRVWFSELFKRIKQYQSTCKQPPSSLCHARKSPRSSPDCKRSRTQWSRQPSSQRCLPTRSCPCLLLVMTATNNNRSRQDQLLGLGSTSKRQTRKDRSSLKSTPRTATQSPCRITKRNPVF